MVRGKLRSTTITPLGMAYLGGRSCTAESKKGPGVVLLPAKCRCGMVHFKGNCPSCFPRPPPVWVPPPKVLRFR